MFELFPVELINRDLVVRSAVQILFQLRWSRVGKDEPVVDDGHARAKFICFRHIVCRENNGSFGLLDHPVPHDTANDDACLDIDAERRIIVKQYLRVGDETAHRLTFWRIPVDRRFIC